MLQFSEIGELTVAGIFFEGKKVTKKGKKKNVKTMPLLVFTVILLYAIILLFNITIIILLFAITSIIES